MGHRDSCNCKQVRSNRILCILAAAGAVSVLVYFSSQLLDGEETVEIPRLGINFSSLRNSQGVDSLVPSASPPLQTISPPLQNISGIADNGDEKYISPQSWDGNSPSAGPDGYENGDSVNQSYGGENSVSEKGPLKEYPDQTEEKESKPLEQSLNISDFSAVDDRRTISDFSAVDDRRTDGEVYTVAEKENPPVQCDIYSGSWVSDDSYPLYRAGECPYMSGAFDCKGNGRPDSGYTQWRWQPRDCNIPRLDATNMLEKFRGKRIMFIGDSINRNQWESLICILTTVVPQNRKYFASNGTRTTFLAKDYNCTVEFFWAPFLVEQGSVNVGNLSKEILRIDAIENHGTYWKDFDILVFNSGHWWTHGNKAATRDFYQEGDYLHPEMDPMVAFEKGLTAWAKWIDHNIDHTKTKVFFRGYSPMHFSSEQWHKRGTHKCNFETKPFLEEWFVQPFPVMMQVLDKVLGRMKFPVSLLNITKLSDFRKDAHPSVYTLRSGKKLTQEQRNNPDDFGDCSHWCLPGLPDIWNELLFGSLDIQAGGTPMLPRSRLH